MDEAIRGFALGLFFGILLPALRELLPAGDGGGGADEEEEASTVWTEDAFPEPAVVEELGPRPWDWYPVPAAASVPPGIARTPRRLVPAQPRRRASKLRSAHRG
jgi:hypothetical protein